MTESEVKIEEVVDEEVPELADAEEEAGDDAGETQGPGRGKQSRSEKKTRKQMQKLGLKQVPGVERMCVTKSGQMMFYISKPDVFKSPTADTYVIFGEARAAEELGQQALSQQVAAMNQDLPDLADDTTKEESAESKDESTSDAGVSEKDIDLVMSQSHCTREKAIEVLKKNNNDIVNAIMELSS